MQEGRRGLHAGGCCREVLQAPPPALPLPMQLHARAAAEKRCKLPLQSEDPTLPTHAVVAPAVGSGTSGGLDSGRAWLGFGLSVVSMLAATMM